MRFLYNGTPLALRASSLRGFSVQIRASARFLFSEYQQKIETSKNISKQAHRRDIPAHS